MEPLSVKEACRSMKIGKTKLYAMIEAREIPAQKLGRKTVIFKHDVDGYLAGLPAMALSKKG